MVTRASTLEITLGMTNIRKALDQFKSIHHTYRKYYVNAVETMLNKHESKEWKDYVSANIDSIIVEFREVKANANIKSLNYRNSYSYAKKFRNEGAEEIINKHLSIFTS